MLARGIAAVAVTLGEKGALVGTGEGLRLVPGYRVNALDTTGAGDAFWGGFLCGLLECGAGDGRPAAGISLEEVVRAAELGNAVAGLCVQKRGGIPAMPDRAEVQTMMREGKRCE